MEKHFPLWVLESCLRNYNCCGLCSSLTDKTWGPSRDESSNMAKSRRVTATEQSHCVVTDLRATMPPWEICSLSIAQTLQASWGNTQKLAFIPWCVQCRLWELCPQSHQMVTIFSHFQLELVLNFNMQPNYDCKHFVKQTNFKPFIYKKKNNSSLVISTCTKALKIKLGRELDNPGIKKKKKPAPN